MIAKTYYRGGCGQVKIQPNDIKDFWELSDIIY